MDTILSVLVVISVLSMAIFIAFQTTVAEEAMMLTSLAPQLPPEPQIFRERK
jgi:hypothetical protein